MENSAFASLSNNAPAAAAAHGSLWLYVGITGLIVLVVAGIYYYVYAPAKPLDILPVVPVAPTPVPSTSNVAIPTAWCLVGEDLSGRYCVRVPSVYSCDPNRTFDSRESCELTPAQALPSGIQLAGGQAMKPLSSLSLS